MLKLKTLPPLTALQPRASVPDTFIATGQFVKMRYGTAKNVNGWTSASYFYPSVFVFVFNFECMMVKA